ncbi:MAG: hypothetical protein HPY53_01320 [Brevinematales bacterium]|nr:hypothetical protein [Brevinematales bacterium]
MIKRLKELFALKRKEDIGLYSDRNAFEVGNKRVMITVISAFVIIGIFAYLFLGTTNTKKNGLIESYLMTDKYNPKAAISFTKNQLVEEQRLYEMQGDEQMKSLTEDVEETKENLEKTAAELEQAKKYLEEQKQKQLQKKPSGGGKKPDNVKPDPIKTM